MIFYNCAKMCIDVIMWCGAGFVIMCTGTVIMILLSVAIREVLSALRGK